MGFRGNVTKGADSGAAFALPALLPPAIWDAGMMARTPEIVLRRP